MTHASKRSIPRDAQGNERRLVQLDTASVTRTMRAADEGGGEDTDAPIGFAGHAAVYGARTYIGRAPWGFYEEIAAGAFEPTLGDDVRFLVNHDPNLLLARTTNGTLRLSEDKIGLDTDADLAPTQVGRDLALLLERGDIDQMSFAFEVGEDRWEVLEDDDGNPVGELRTIVEFKQLYDVSVVTYPAYAQTDAALRAAGFDLLVSRLGLDDERVRSLLASADKRDEGETPQIDQGADLAAYARRHRHLEHLFRG